MNLYIDLNDDTSVVGTEANYAILKNLSAGQATGDLLQGRTYYIYFQHPETPAATPLSRDDTENDGYEFVIRALGSNGNSIQIDLDVYYTTLP